MLEHQLAPWKPIKAQHNIVVMSVDIRHNVSRSSVGTARMSVSRNTFSEPQNSHYKPFYVTDYTPGSLF